MQAGRQAMASAKETAANVAASATSGMEKTKATLQGKVEKMTASSVQEKEMAEERKQQRIHDADTTKQQAMERHAAAREHAGAGCTGGATTTGGLRTTHTTGAPGVETGRPLGGHVIEGMDEARPIGLGTGTGTGTGRPSVAHNPLAGSREPAAWGTGGRYSLNE